MRWLMTVVLTAMAVLIVAPGCDDGADGDADADVDGDADTDGDGDTVGDADTDSDADADVGPTTGVWSMGYYASWHPEQYPVSEIEWSGLTHVAMAFYSPQPDGSLQLMGGNPEVAADLIDAAHAHGVLAVASIGGADSGPAFREAAAPGTMDSFVGHLIALLDETGYDGIDIDWEPLELTDEPAAIDIATRIRASNPDAALTIPVGYVNPNTGFDLSGYAAIAGVYDQLNIMSYGMAGAWEGWNSWHSSALYQTNAATPLSIDSSVTAYVEAGVPVGQLGLGIGFYGLCYSPPVTGPDQPLDGAAILASDGVMSYANIMAFYYDETARLWDDLARVPYLSFDSAHAPDGCTYISYDDEQSIEEKGAYVRSRGLGGVIQWEINEGYIASAPAGERSPLLLAVRDHVLQ
jgi:chitinase